jgi:predicted O-methyltransferase YrrM
MQVLKPSGGGGERRGILYNHTSEMTKMKRFVFESIFRIKRLINNMRYPEKTRRKIQMTIYREMGLDREEGLKQLNKILNELKMEEYTENNNMYSEHLIIMSSISIKRDQGVRDILEIGTYDGVTTMILSKLFKDANIKTIDLPRKNTSFTTTYKRETNSDIFADLRDQRLSKYKNIVFREKDSIHLGEESEKYDLIWVDGAHGFPMISIDICNGLRLLRHGGIMLTDDIIKDKYIKEDPIYTSRKGYEMLKTYSKSRIAETKYFYKRLEDRHMKIIKYIGCSQLIERN